MGWYAVDRLDDAVAASRGLLLPFDSARWLRLAVITLFVGTVGGAPAGPSTLNWRVERTVGFQEVTPRTLLAILAAAAVLLLIGLVFAAIASVMEFALVESLRREEVHLRAYARRFLRPGLRLFAVRVALAVVGVAVAGTLVAVVAAAAAIGGPVAAVLVGLVALPLGAVAAVLVLAAERFTVLFVVPTMLAEEVGVLAGWRRLWPVLRGEFRETLVYAAIVAVLYVLAGAVVAMALVLPAIPIVVVFAAIAWMGASLVSVSAVVGFAIVAVAVLLAALLLLAVLAVVQVPVQVFLRYHTLLVLGDLDADLDLIADRRAAVSD